MRELTMHKDKHVERLTSIYDLFPSHHFLAIFEVYNYTLDQEGGSNQPSAD